MGLISRYSAYLTARDGTPKAPRTPEVQPSADPANEEPHTPNPDSPPAQPGAVHARYSIPLIVGIGGSAGSLSPLRELVAAIPVDSGMSFVVVSHQPPTGHSMLPEILAKCTEMPVLEITDEARAEPNHVYVAPRGQNVELRAGILSLKPVTQRSIPYLPIDRLFKALAKDQGTRAVGIVLSGTGTDGTLGLVAIRAEAGLSLVQDPATAEFDGMPSSAIRARAADFVVPPAEMPARLHVHQQGHSSLKQADTDPEMSADAIAQILTIMHERGGHDFSEYKHGTLIRRVVRRMKLHGFDDIAEYARLLEQSAEEIDALWHDWLIGVSSFFRDPEVFPALEAVLPELLAGRNEGSLLRIWVPGCATGEETYSLVILLLETLQRLDKHLELKVFATDINPDAIHVARAGRYPEGIAENVSEARLARFFTRNDGFYFVRQELRDHIVFAAHDVLHDPPFSRVDLVSCRNLLIYFEPAAQRRLLRSFHYSLNPRGLLLLGTSEHANGSEEYFSPVDSRLKIYRRNDATEPQSMLRWPVGRADVHNDLAVGHHPTPEPSRDAVTADLANPVSLSLAERFGPPAVLVDAAGRIQQIHGQVGAYLGLHAGRFNETVVDMARKGLRTPLASALREAIETGDKVAKRSARLHVDGVRVTVRLEVSRLRAPRIDAPLYLISFERTGRKAHPKNEGSDVVQTDNTTRGSRQQEQEQEQELEDTRHELHGSIGEIQAVNEELATANEESQSANEELQSTNEELQTAKEETQSLNEELQTVNAELTRKLESFEEATDDLTNLMNNIEVATIFLDGQLRVRRFTPQAHRVSHLIEGDIGRPLADLVTHVDYPDLLADAASVIETLQASETRATASDGCCYLVRIRPYRTTRNVVDGVVVTFFDITDARRSERLEAARTLAENIVDTVREPFLVLDDGLHIVQANHAYYRMFGSAPEETEGRPIGDLADRQWNSPVLRERLEKARREVKGFEDFEVEATFPADDRRRLLFSARLLSPRNGDDVELILLGIQEISEPQVRGENPEAGA